MSQQSPTDPSRSPAPGDAQPAAPTSSGRDHAAAPVPAAAQSSDSPPPTISIDDFLKIDLRIATVKTCREHPNADKLLILELDDGTPEGRQVCAGLRGIYQPDDLVGRQIVIVANLAPRKMRGEVSQGMLLAASGEDRSQVIIVTPIAHIAPGSRVG